MDRSRRTPQPLDPARLEELALAYAARFATTRAKLEAYLQRKLRERGWGGDEPAAVASLAARMVDAGYVDDAAFARARGGSLLRRGYGGGRVSQALQAAGIAADLRDEAMPGEGAQRRAALVMARKRGFGPFARAAAPVDRAAREKQVAAMLRAGHPLDSVREILNAADEAAAEAWAGAADEDDPCA